MRAPTEKQKPAISDLSREFCQSESQTSRRENILITHNNCMIDINVVNIDIVLKLTIDL